MDGCDSSGYTSCNIQAQLSLDPKCNVMTHNMVHCIDTRSLIFAKETVCYSLDGTLKNASGLFIKLYNAPRWPGFKNARLPAICLSLVCFLVRILWPPPLRNILHQANEYPLYENHILCWLEWHSTICFVQNLPNFPNQREVVIFSLHNLSRTLCKYIYIYVVFCLPLLLPQ